MVHRRRALVVTLARLISAALVLNCVGCSSPDAAVEAGATNPAATSAATSGPGDPGDDSPSSAEAFGEIVRSQPAALAPDVASYSVEERLERSADVLVGQVLDVRTEDRARPAPEGSTNTVVTQGIVLVMSIDEVRMGPAGRGAPVDDTVELFYPFADLTADDDAALGDAQQRAVAAAPTGASIVAFRVDVAGDVVVSPTSVVIEGSDGVAVTLDPGLDPASMPPFADVLTLVRHRPLAE